MKVWAACRCCCHEPLPRTGACGGGEWERSFVRNEDEYGFTDDDHDEEYLLKKVASEILRRESSSMPDESKTVICGIDLR